MNDEPLKSISDNVTPEASPDVLRGAVIPVPNVPSSIQHSKVGDAEHRVRKQEPQVLNFASFVHNYLWASITFGEQKAAFVFAIDSAFLGYLFSQGLLWGILQPISRWHSSDLLAGLTLLAFIISLSAILSVIMPRLGGAGSGIIYFRSIANRTSEEYLQDVAKRTEGELEAAVLQHCHELSRIAFKKHFWLRIAAWTGLAGLLIGLVLIAEAVPHPPAGRALLL